MGGGTGEGMEENQLNNQGMEVEGRGKWQWNISGSGSGSGNLIQCDYMYTGFVFEGIQIYKHMEEVNEWSVC